MLKTAEAIIPILIQSSASLCSSTLVSFAAFIGECDMFCRPVESFGFQQVFDADEFRLENEELVLEGEAALHEFGEMIFREWCLCFHRLGSFCVAKS
jgi:hypothetical protein